MCSLVTRQTCGTYAVVDSFEDFVIEERSGIGVTNLDRLAEVEVGDHGAGIGDVGDEELGTRIADVAVGSVTSTVVCEVAEDT